MKNMDKTKLIVLVIGGLSLITGLTQTILSSNLMEHFFSIYIGLTLIGTALLHKEESQTEVVERA